MYNLERKKYGKISSKDSWILITMENKILYTAILKPNSYIFCPFCWSLFSQMGAIRARILIQ
jgi:hypothetical protein